MGRMGRSFRERWVALILIHRRSKTPTAFARWIKEALTYSRRRLYMHCKNQNRFQLGPLVAGQVDRNWIFHFILFN